jgi:adenylate cyclase
MTMTTSAAEARTALIRWAGHTVAHTGREFEMGGVALERALTLNPNSAQVYSASGWVRFYLGDAETAIVHFNRAIRLSPLDPEMGYMLSGLAHAYLFTERYEEALNYATRSVREWPTWLPGRLARAAALVQLQKLGEAAQEIRAVRDMNPDPRCRDLSARWQIQISASELAF